MKKYIILLFLFLGCNLYSQNNDIIILVRDSATDQAIAEVSILAIEIKKSGVTNKEGVFKLSIRQQVTLELDHPEYNSVHLHSSLLTERLNIIYLDKKANLETETVVREANPHGLLVNLIENSINTLTNPIALKVYVLEFYKLNNLFTSFNDGLLKYYIAGKSGQIKADIIVEQNRFYSIVPKSYGSNIMGYNLDKLIKSNYNFTYLNLFFNKKESQKYNYTVTSSLANTSLYKIKAELKNNVHEALPNYEITYDPSKMLIIEVKAAISEENIKYAVIKKFDLDKGKLLSSVFKANYKINENLYHLSCSSEDIHIEMFRKSGSTDTLNIKNYFVVNDVNTESLNYNKKSVFKQKSLNKISTKYYNNYWDFNSGLTPTTEEAEIIQQLSSETLN